MDPQVTTRHRNARHTATYRLKFTGGIPGGLAITVAAITVLLLPVAVLMLITSLEVEKYE